MGFRCDGTMATSLPAGWESHRDVSEKVYYHHSARGLSQWEHPGKPGNGNNGNYEWTRAELPVKIEQEKVLECTCDGCGSFHCGCNERGSSECKHPIARLPRYLSQNEVCKSCCCKECAYAIKYCRCTAACRPEPPPPQQGVPPPPPRSAGPPPNGAVGRSDVRGARFVQEVVNASDVSRADRLTESVDRLTDVIASLTSELSRMRLAFPAAADTGSP